MSPKNDPLWFRAGFWLLWHPGLLVAAIVIYGCFMFALGRYTRDG